MKYDTCSDAVSKGVFLCEMPNEVLSSSNHVQRTPRFSFILPEFFFVVFFFFLHLVPLLLHILLHNNATLRWHKANGYRKLNADNMLVRYRKAMRPYTTNNQQKTKYVEKNTSQSGCRVRGQVQGTVSSRG